MIRIEEGFQPIPFYEENAYLYDPVLPSLLKRLLPDNVHEQVQPDLERLGHDVVTTLRTLSNSGKVFPPKLLQYDQWGRRIDDLQTSEGWRELKAIAQKEGLPGIFYERKFGEHSRVYGFAKMLLMVGDTNEVFCPLSMTDGAARVIELLGSDALKKDILPRLISRDPEVAFTSGQWMTERPGGSDVSKTETTATDTGRSHPYGAEHTLNGVKWFSSATDSQIAVALARTGAPLSGSRGLSLFLVPLRLPLFGQQTPTTSSQRYWDLIGFTSSTSTPAPASAVPSATSNGVLVHRLKNKIGTQILPTAELTLNETTAYMIGAPGSGVKNITPVLNITRLWSTIGSVGNLRKCLALATSYATVRTISVQRQDQLLSDTPVHVAQLASVNLLYRALTHLAFEVIRLLGKSECGTATKDEERRLRMLTPVAKAYAAEKACHAMEEAMAALGGVGYMEESGIGRSIRDALVEKIWEGTIVVLSLDLLRSAQDSEVLKAFIKWAESTIAACHQSQLSSQLGLVKEALRELAQCYEKPSPLMPRPALMLVGSIASSMALLEHALWSLDSVDVEVFRRWVEEGSLKTDLEAVKRVRTQSARERTKVDREMVFGKARL